MIDGLKPYAEYKDMDIPSFGPVPKDWKTLRAKYCYREVDERSKTGREVLCSVSHKTGVTPRKSNVTMFMAESTVGYKICRPNDLVINTLWAWMAALGIARQVGIVSPAYGVYRPLTNSPLFPSYADRLLRTPQYMREYMARSTGVNASRLRLYPEQFLCIALLIPPPDEQAAIVKFLDYANAKIERAIRAKRKEIGLLNEQKQAIIHLAVTRGLDPNVKLKPSGIPWLGDVPEHWEVRPIKNWAKINLRTLGQSTNPNFEFRYIDIGSVRTGYLVKEPELMQFAKAPSRARRVLFPGDTIVSTVRTYLKAVWFVGLEAENLIASTGFAVFSPNDELEPEYLHYILQDSSFVNQVTANSIGIAYPAIAETVIARFRVPIPPSRVEQQAVIAAIKLQLKPVIDLITRLQYEIDLLREYRTTLTAEVVTGKLDVREVAKRLPDQADETLPADESLDDLVDDEITEEVEA
jgi:type I restriction enzyme, S subunit